LIGVAQPVNLLFFFTVVLLVLVAVQLSYELSRHEMRIRRLAEEVALLRDEINQRNRPSDDD
jgi:cell division protein ZapA (FtsZ GTPase activity inhibitor)